MLRMTKKACGIIVLVTVFVLSAQLSAEEATSVTPPPEDQKLAAATPHLSEIIPLSVQLSARLSELENKIGRGVDVTALADQYAQINVDMTTYTTQLADLRQSGDYRTARLLRLKQRIEEENKRLEFISRPLQREIRQLELWQKSWSDEKSRWSQWYSSLVSAESSHQIQSIFINADKKIEAALKMISPHLEGLLAEQQKIAVIQEQMYSVMTQLDGLITEKRFGSIFYRSVPMFSSEYFTQLKAQQWGAFKSDVESFLWSGRDQFSRRGWFVFLEGVLFLFLGIAIYRNRNVLKESSRWNFIAQRPFAAGLFLMTGIASLVYEYAGALALWKLINLPVAGISFARLAGAVVKESWKKQFVYGIVTVLVITRLMVALSFPIPFFRLYMVVAGLAMLVLCWKWAKDSACIKSPLLYTGLFRLGSVFFAAVVLAQVWGKESLAYYLFFSVMMSVGMIPVFMLFMRLIHGGLEWLFHTSILRKITFLYTKDVDLIVRRTCRFVDIVLWGLILLPVILLIWGAYDSLVEATLGFWAFGFDLGALRLSVGLLIVAAGVVYGSFLISWIIQKLFLDVVLRKRQIEIGVRLSIERLIHYFVLFIGFMVAISVIGFEITKLTIVLSALGVGIGFGLQGVVNNFVSGLILLFERPVRVGDTIQIGEQWAQVRHIGLRATTVQTFDNSDLIIPNADLVSNQVTNWTLSNRQVRLIVPVGVAYGSDVPRVFEILQACARDNEQVSKYPEPYVLFLNFGASSLDFELRVWVSADIRLITKSQLLQEIDKRFREANIVIAFPQRDLHIRSMDQSVPLPNQSPGVLKH